MGLLLRLGSGISKNGILPAVVRKQTILPRTFGETDAPAKLDSISYPIPKNEYVRENLHIIGKGSDFEKLAVQEYLAPLRSHPFSRHRIRDDYDESSAKSFNSNLNNIKRAHNSKAILFNRTYQFVGDMLAILIPLTPNELTINGSTRSFLNEAFTEVPPIPDFKIHTQLFEDYIGLLTHTHFYYKKSSKLNGIIPKMLRNLMHPSNINTMHLKNVNVYNDVIYFFSERFDFATCRELFVQMKIEGIHPNTRTFNLMLRNLLKNSHIRKSKLPHKEALYYLNRMKSCGIQADTITWTTCYQLLMEDISRDIFIEKMVQNNVPITSNFVYAVFRNGSYSSKEVLRFLSEHSVPLNSKLFNLCIRKLAEEQNFQVAWAFMNHAYENANFNPSHECLNIFLRSFAEQGRLDLALLTFNTATIKYEIRPNIHSFDMLFKALVRNGYTKKFPVVLEYLKQKLKAHTKNVSIFSYWLLKARGISKFNIKKTCTEDQVEVARKILDSALWDSGGIKWNCWKECGAELRKAFRLLGCVPTSMKEQPSKKIKFDTTEVAKIKKASYKKRIRFLAIQNSMVKRIPYANDRHSALKSELSRRNILKQQ